MREIESILKIMFVKDVNKIIKNFNYFIFVYLNDDIVLIKYSSRVNEKLRLLFKDQEGKVSDFKMNEIGLVKKRGVVFVVYIVLVILFYVRMDINEFKNILGNFCIMSDIDCVVLFQKLDGKYIGIDLG